MATITAQTMRLPFRVSRAAQPQMQPRVVPIPRRMNVMTDVPIETSVMRTSWSAAHKPRFREYQVFQEATRDGQSTKKRAVLSFKAYSTSCECCTHSNTSAACPRRRMIREISSSEGSFFVDSGVFAVVVLPSPGPTL